jgi:hypothetical protein
MIDTPVQLELFEEPTPLPGSPQQTCTDGANTTADVPKPAIVANRQSSIATHSESVQPAADDFFEIVGTEVPMRLADHIGTKTPEKVREIIAKIGERVGSKVARP